MTGKIFDIQGFSVHDGPGARTLLFLSGCPLACKWCSNPEGRYFRPVPMYSSLKCAHDKDCVKACPDKAITLKEQRIEIDRSICMKCAAYECAKACCTGALRIAGYEITVERVMKILERDRQYWGGGGGVTLTGGEPFAQPDFAFEILKRSNDSNIHTVVETCLSVPEENYIKSLDYINWMFIDIKHMDSLKHTEGTGSGNKHILKNIELVSRHFKGELVFRMVVIPGYNDSDEHIRLLAKFLSGLSLERLRINLLPLHHFGREKYNMLGIEYPFRTLDNPDNQSMQAIREILIASGIECFVGNNTPF